MKDKITKVIIFAFAASAVIMLSHAFAPALYGAIAAKTWALIVFGLSLVFASLESSEEKFFGAKAIFSMAAVFAAGAVVALLDGFILSGAGLSCLAALVAAVLGAALAKALGCSIYGCALVAGAAAAYLSGGALGEMYAGFCSFAIGFGLFTLVMQGLEKKLVNPAARIAAAFIICLVSFAF